MVGTWEKGRIRDEAGMGLGPSPDFGLYSVGCKEPLKAFESMT